MKIILHLLIILVASITFYPFSSTHADSNHKVISEKDAEYIIKGIDVDSGKFNPDIPQNETQSTLSNSVQDFVQLNLETSKKIASIGPFEFSTFTELKNKTSVSRLKRNLKKYWDIKKVHYDSMDTLLKKYRKKLNYGSEQGERLAGTAQQFIEKLEEKYITDLNDFYEFISKHHEKINFTEDQIYLEDQGLVNALNTLWEKAVESAIELTTAQEMGGKIIGESVKEYQKEINVK